LLVGCAVGAALGGGGTYLSQRLSGRKVLWDAVGASALTGCVSGLLLDGALTTATRPLTGIVGKAESSTFEKVYRVYGGDSRAGGASWSPIDPRLVGNYRDVAGLPSGGASGAMNTGRFAIEGELIDPSRVILRRNALPLDGTKGGLLEYIIPNWIESGAIRIVRVSGINPGF
jgi:hypothetical protein